VRQELGCVWVRRSWCNRSEAAIQWKTQEPLFFAEGVKQLLENVSHSHGRHKTFISGQKNSLKDRKMRIIRQTMPSQVWGTLPSLQYSRDFFPQHLVLPLSETASAINGPWGWSSSFWETELQSQCSGVREGAVVLYLCL